MSCYKNNLNLNPYVKNLIKNEKGCKRFYEVIAKTRLTALPTKWFQDLSDIREKEYLKVCKRLEEIHEIKLRDFLFKLNTKIIVTKSFLLKINKSENDLCSYCRSEPDTIHHLFYNCGIIQRFIYQVYKWFQDQCSINFENNFE